jgi:hypothetical protein
MNDVRYAIYIVGMQRLLRRVRLTLQWILAGEGAALGKGMRGAVVKHQFCLAFDEINKSCE